MVPGMVLETDTEMGQIMGKVLETVRLLFKLRFWVRIRLRFR